MTKKTSVKKAIDAISSGDARGLRKYVNEALVEKVRKALDKKEKEIARSLIESAVIKEAVTVVVTNDIFTKDGQVVVKSGTKLSVSSKDELAKKVKLSPRELFVDSTHENLFDSIAAKGGTAYVYLDPYDFDISNQLRLGVAKSKQDADEQENDSAGDI